MSRRSPSLWRPLPQGSEAPCDRHKHACCSHEGHVYVLGGRGRGSLGDFWRYNVACNEWTELDCSSAAAPEELEEHSMVAYQDFIYVFGGMIDSAYTDWKSSLWVFDIGREKWVHWQSKTGSPQKNQMQPVNRKGHSAVVFGPAMYIYGGYVDLKGSSQEFWTLDFDTMRWSLVESSPGQVGPGPRHSHSAMAHLDSMYLFGGLRGLREQRDFWRWSSTSLTWSSLKTTSGPSRLLGHSAVLYRDSMLLFGGGESLGSPNNCLWRYSFATESWEKLAVLAGSSPPARIHHCCVGLGPGYQPKASALSHSCSTLSKLSLDTKLRPFKNKCSPSSSNWEVEGAIELDTFSMVKGRAQTESGDGSTGRTGKDAQIGRCLTFENLLFDKERGSEEDSGVEPVEESIAQHLPDLLLLLGGKPLGGHAAAISVWQMTLTDL